MKNNMLYRKALKPRGTINKKYKEQKELSEIRKICLCNIRKNLLYNIKAFIKRMVREGKIKQVMKEIRLKKDSIKHMKMRIKMQECI